MLNNLRVADLSDIQDILYLENTCFEKDRMSESEIKNLILRKNRSKIIIYCFGGNITIGYAALVFFKDSCLLYSFCIDPILMGRRIAKRFLNKLHFNYMHYEFLLTVRRDNERAIRLYNKAGYVIDKIKASYYRDGSEAIFMRREKYE